MGLKPGTLLAQVCKAREFGQKLRSVGSQEGIGLGKLATFLVVERPLYFG